MASVKVLFIPLCLQPTKRRSLIYIFKKEREKTLEPARSEASSLSPFNIPAALEGQRGSGNSRVSGRASETEAGAKGGGHKICMLEETRWT